MSISLDPEQNPILRVYQLFTQPNVEPKDGPQYLGLANLRLKKFGGEQAQELIQFLRQTAGPDLNSCRLTLAGQLLINFAANLVTDWFEWETIDELAQQGQLSQAARDILLDRQEQIAQYKLDHYWSPGRDPVADCLAVLDELGNLQASESQEDFTLELNLAKTGLVRKYLLGELPGSTEDVSGLLWYSPALMQRAFSKFQDFLRYISQAARHPLIFFFFEPAAPYLGDFCKILSLTSPNPGVDQEAILTEQLQTFTAPHLAEYDELRIRHQYENRPNIGERFDLPPALLLRQNGHLTTYPAHSLFIIGSLRSLLVYTLLAWLAEKTEPREGTTYFSLPAPDKTTTEVALQFSSTDVRQQETSLFESGTPWQELVLLLAHDIQRSAGRKRLRELWHQALLTQSAEDFTADKFFASLETVRAQFNQLEQAPLDIGGDVPDLEIRVFLDKKAEGDQLKFELHSATRRLNFFHKNAGDTPLGTDDPNRRFHDLNELAKQYLSRILEPDEPDVAPSLPDVSKLETRGRELWTKLIPNDLKQDYADFRKEQDLAMLIVSTDPAFPWELVRPYAKKGDIAPERIDDLWWALQFCLARWLAGTLPPASTNAFHRVCCVATTSQLSSAQAELEYFQNSKLYLDQPTTKAELLELLGTQGYDVIHFACHGQFDTDQPGESVVQLPDRSLLRPRDLYDPAIEEMIGEHRPLIFLNACHSGRAGPAITGLGGWVERFIEMECGAFIGCGWEVADPLAAEFAVTFYKAFRQGKDLGQAVHLARQQIRQKHPDNSTWLAYYLYGNPRCKLKQSS